MSTAADTVKLSLPFETQKVLAEDVRRVCKASPLVRPVTAAGGDMLVRVTAAGSLGWVGDGEYRYDPVDRRGKPWPRMPERWRDIASQVAGEHPWDCAIINWYDEGASLGFHQDLAEANLEPPIVTISLGDTASWAVREGPTGPASRCRIDSGDVTLLAGNQRLWFHAIERLIPNPMFTPLRGPGRISITIRVAGKQ